MGRRAAALAWVLVLSGATAAQAKAPAAKIDFHQALAASQAAVGQVVGDYPFVDRDGRSVRSAGWRGRPVVLSLVYTSCDQVCSVTTRYLAKMVTVARDALGTERFGVVTVGFDAGVDTPARMASYAREHGIDDPRWSFLSADEATVTGLAHDTGFTYARSPRGFDHLAQVTILDREGRVYRQIYGERFEPPALVEPLKELLFGRTVEATTLGRWVDGVRLLCTVYDPSSGRYRFDYSVIVGGVIGIVCLTSIAVFLVRAWRDTQRALHR